MQEIIDMQYAAISLHVFYSHCIMAVDNSKCKI